jgi:hypothetical protein
VPEAAAVIWWGAAAMSIGLNIRYRNSEEVSWPYLTQRHLTGFLWPLARSLGLWRIELMEVLPSYKSEADAIEMTTDFEDIERYLNDPSMDHRYADIEHVRNRTRELVDRLWEVLARWAEVEELDFF